jgi:hypothetical protein
MKWKYLSPIEKSSTSYISQSPVVFHMIASSLALSTHYDRPGVTQILLLDHPALPALVLYLETSLLSRCKNLVEHPQLSKGEEVKVAI